MSVPADLQKVWHKFVGKMFSNISILDVGAGQGFSKDRLSKNNNCVTTQDINRNLMNNVDVICELGDVAGDWDLITAFDVIEHAPSPLKFLYDLKQLSSKMIFVTTPNGRVYTNPWHYNVEEMITFINKIFPHQSLNIYGRYKGADYDYVKLWNKVIDKNVHYFGFFIHDQYMDILV